MLGISVMILYWAGARGFLLLGLAFLVSALASYVLLNKQRQVMAARLNRRLNKAGAKATEFRERLEEGTAAEDEDDGETAAADSSGAAADEADSSARAAATPATAAE